jgi:hypothetical protein
MQPPAQWILWETSFDGQIALNVSRRVANLLGRSSRFRYEGRFLAKASEQQALSEPFKRE